MPNQATFHFQPFSSIASKSLRSAIFIWVTICFSATLVSAQPCSRDAVKHAAGDAKALREKLVSTTVADGMDPSVPEPTQKQIRALKDAVARATAAYLRCEPVDPVDLKAMETSLLAQMAVNEPKDAPSPAQSGQAVSGVYGTSLQISASHPEGQPGLIAVTASFGINCGSDAMLLVFERQGDTWRQALRWQADAYDQISGAFGGFFQFAVLPQSEKGPWLVAAVHGTPWCTSRWSGWHLDLLQPARGSTPQKVVQHLKNGYARGNEPVFKRRSDGFEFRVERSSLDISVMTRTGIYRYRLAGDQLQRVQPIAMNGRDFVDEWLQVEWDEAQRWSDPASLSSLQKGHEKFAALIGPKATDRPQFTFGPVRGCTDDPKHFQVELKLDPGATNYFQLKLGENSFTMLAAGTQADARCKGADLMRKR
jgi:hypothetical protein